MHHLKALTIACLVAASLTTTSHASSITPAVQYTTASYLNDYRPFTIGYAFTLSGSVTVNALGYWDDGNGYDHDVGIWDSNGNLLASTTVLGSDPLVDQFLWHPIALLTLSAGTYKIGGQAYEDGNAYQVPVNLAGLTTIPQYTWLSNQQVPGAGLNYPAYDSGYGDNGILFPNFSVGGAIGTPEPITLSLAGAGLAGVAATRRRKKKANG